MGKRRLMTRNEVVPFIGKLANIHEMDGSVIIGVTIIGISRIGNIYCRYRRLQFRTPDGEDSILLLDVSHLTNVDIGCKLIAEMSE